MLLLLAIFAGFAGLLVLGLLSLIIIPSLVICSLLLVFWLVFFGLFIFFSINLGWFILIALASYGLLALGRLAYLKYQRSKKGY